MKTAFPIIFLLILTSFTVEAQIVNSNKITVGEFFDGEVNRFEINGGKTILQLRIPDWFFGKLKNSILKDTKYIKSGTKLRSAYKKRNLFLEGGITNSGPLFDVDNFNFNERAGLAVGLTYQNSFSTIYLVDNEIAKPFNLASWQLGIKYANDRFQNFDPLTNQEGQVGLSVWSIESSVSTYIFLMSHSKPLISIVPTFYAVYSPEDYNRGDLKNYVDNTLADQLTNSIVITKGSGFDGKYGTISIRQSATFAFSIPMIIECLPKTYPTIGFIPYSSIEYFEGASKRSSAGFAIGLLAKGLIGKDRVKDDDGHGCRKFNAPSFVSVGFDWNTIDGQRDESPNIFLSGNIKF